MLIEKNFKIKKNESSRNILFFNIPFFFTISVNVNVFDIMNSQNFKQSNKFMERSESRDDTKF